MPKLSNDPEKLRPYLFHGVDLQKSPGDKNWKGQCPFCGKEGDKFSVNERSGLAQCWSCQEGSEKGGGVNDTSFLRKLHEQSLEDTENARYEELAKERGYWSAESLKAWGLAVSVLTGDWLLPGYGPKLSVRTLYRYTSTGKRNAWIPTPTMGHHLFGGNLYKKKCTTCFLAEGIWDCIALWEVLNAVEAVNGGFALTKNRKKSLLKDTSVLGIPAAKVFDRSWCPLFSGKIVNLMCQNDHERTNPQGKKIAPASYTGMQRVARILAGSSKPPKQINFLYLGDQGYDPGLPSGYDLRDHLTRRT